MKESSHKFINYLLQNLDAEDYSFKPHIRILFRNLLKKTDKYEEITIDKNTNIITFPYYAEKIKESKRLLDQGIQNFNEKVLYIKELNMLITNDGMTHRIAALYLYTQEKNPLILKCNITTIKEEYLKKYYFNPYTLSIRDILNNQTYQTDKYFFNYLKKMQQEILGRNNIEYTKQEQIKYILQDYIQKLKRS